MASKPTLINDLPNEVLLEILSYFGPEDLCLIIAKVCDRWKCLAKDVILWKKLSFHCGPSSNISLIEEVLTAAPALHWLVIHDYDTAVEILKFLFHKRVGLRKLTLYDFCQDGIYLLVNMMSWYPDLEGLSLKVHYNSLSSADYSLIPQLKKLSEMDLSYCEELRVETVRLIADSCQLMKKLILDGVSQIHDDDVIYVINRLGKKLTTLVLNGENLTDVAYLYLQNCARLQELKVSCCYNMTDRGLLDGMGQLHELTFLHLSFAENVTAQAFSMLFRQPSISSIISLDLSSCRNLDDEVLKGIAERYINLKKLEVSECCNVTDAGIRMVVKHCSQLRLLGLSFIYSITGNGWLSVAPSFLPHLRQLNLFRCDILCYKYVVELDAAVPALNIFHGS